MKKLVSFVLAAVLCVGMTTSVMAAQSPTPVGNVQISDKFDSDELAVVDSLKNADGEVTYEAVTDAFEEAGVTVAVESIDFVVIEDVDTTAGSAEISVTVPVGYNYTWKAVVYNFNTNKWDAASVSFDFTRNVVTVTSDHFCPVVLVAEQTAVLGGNVVTDATTSPKTADVMVGLYAVAALAGTVVAARKVKESK